MARRRTKLPRLSREEQERAWARQQAAYDRRAQADLERRRRYRSWAILAGIAALIGVGKVIS